MPKMCISGEIQIRRSHYATALYFRRNTDSPPAYTGAQGPAARRPLSTTGGCRVFKWTQVVGGGARRE